ncbi:Triacylglycerol lipase 2-like protein [Quillaja saponaria]|uniref:Triacylglycerol lipase 2-like protein n=1 Tax=Quillaja saponaria TaxID=32244 RepID=A0AAD7LLF9_QUISA|nr:Triacylglycerol lipase 2-like protein [Quillaja saponaria]
MKNNYRFEHSGIQKIIGSGSCTFSACVATAETTLIIGYGLGWRGGKSYANTRFRKEQLKMLGQIKPKGWELLGRIRPRRLQFQLLKRLQTRSRVPESAVRTSEKVLKDALNLG